MNPKVHYDPHYHSHGEHFTEAHEAEYPDRSQKLSRVTLRRVMRMSAQRCKQPDSESGLAWVERFKSAKSAGIVVY